MNHLHVADVTTATEFDAVDSNQSRSTSPEHITESVDCETASSPDSLNTNKRQRESLSDDDNNDAVDDDQQDEEEEDRQRIRTRPPITNIIASASLLSDQQISKTGPLIEPVNMPPPPPDSPHAEPAPRKRRRKREDPQSCFTNSEVSVCICLPLY